MSQEILIVDDEADIRLHLTGILADEGYQTREAGEADQALESLRTRRPNLVILDIWMQNSRLDGLEMLEQISREYPGVPVVMISGHGTIEMAVQAIKNGAYDFIEKPFKADRLLVCVERAMEAARLRMENEELRLRAGSQFEMVGISPAISAVRQAIQRVAPTGSRVLLTGPAGAGKEVGARLLHHLSRRSRGPFVAVNCAAMQPDRLEVELFGTEGEGIGGPRKVGVFERAHGGTLLLDEVADMPLETQGRIVRVLQEQTFERVGGKRRVEVDVRVIASSNRDLTRQIGEGRFREDLYYRLNVVPLRMPPLRERREDIPVLLDFLMDRAAEAAGLPARHFSTDAVTALQAYDWPGNVRQLRNVIDWVLIMAPGGAPEQVPAEHLPPELGAQAPTALRSNGSADLMALPLREAREVFERQYLEAQLLRFGSNISRTASFVGMERSALHRKLRMLGVSSDR
jgi:two-component system nitrogen regulation response regulator NtrX